MRDEKRETIIQDALNLLDDELILEADEQRETSVNTRIKNDFNRKGVKSWRHITTIAASIAIFLIVGMVWNEVIVPNSADKTESIVEESAYEDSIHDLEAGKEADTAIIENCEEVDELSEVYNTDEVKMSQSLQQERETQIHLPCQKVESVAGVEYLTGVLIPAKEVELRKFEDGVAADMLAFFIYEGRCYVQSEYYENGFSCVGDYVGTSVGMIDEWTKEDGYVDYAGSVAGEFYEVKGYDPSFMLCMKFDNGAVETFIHNNGLVLGKGSDLIEDRLHLKDNFEKVTFKTHREWNESLRDEKNHVLSEEYDELMNRFLESFCSDDFVYIADTPLDWNRENNYCDSENNYHLTFHTKDGLRFQFTLYEEGYVRFQEFGSVCVQIDPELYEEIIKALKEG